ncbi:toll/interleukin-1 receptor domain-containing protein [Ureibacillus composti]|nr:toll/interleukin-1 receptor domain-containing protein [Ureibacillus composti]
MQVFLSWSGNESKQLAEIFKDWLPNVLQYVEPYMSSQDIGLGERWNENITKNLSDTNFGLIFVTPSNIKAPWINYEAGALAKTLDSRVIPILYKADTMLLQEGPLKQFQSAKNLDKDSVHRLIKEINTCKKENNLNIERLNKSFDMWWPQLESLLSTIESESTSQNLTESPDEKEILSMIVRKLNDQEKLLKEKQNRIDLRKPLPTDIRFIKEIKMTTTEVFDCLVKCEDLEVPEEVVNTLKVTAERLKSMYMYLSNRS